MPRSVAIVTDSTSDLPAEIRDEYGITVVPLNVHFGQETYRDGVDLTGDAFMARMATTEHLPTTSQPSVGVFEETFRDLAKTHDAIVCVLISARLSGTLQSATLAAEGVAGIVPVEIVDSLNVSYALGLQAMRAAALAAGGMAASEIAATLRTETGRYQLVFFVETLDHLRRGGRIGKAAQLLGSLLKLKPLLRIEEGQIVPFERTRTRSRATNALVSFAGELGSVEQAGIIHITTQADADALATDIGRVTGLHPIPTIRFGPVIAAHVGPGVLGVVLKEAPRG